MANNFIQIISSSVKHWYLPLITGILFIGVGIFSFMQPVESYLALAIVFSIAFLFNGISDIAFAVANRENMEGWGWDLVMGILTSLVGILLISNPAISILTLPFYVGFVVMFRSVSAIGTSLELKKYYVQDWGYLLAIGILGVIFSYILLFDPGFAGMSIVVWTALAFIIIGIFSIYLSLKLKKLHDIPKNISKELKKRFENVTLEVKKEILAEVDKLKSNK